MEQTCGKLTTKTIEDAAAYSQEVRNRDIFSQMGIVINLIKTIEPRTLSYFLHLQRMPDIMDGQKEYENELPPEERKKEDQSTHGEKMSRNRLQANAQQT